MLHREGPMKRNVGPITWLSVTSLDAPLVAIVWQQMFASAAHVTLALAARSALFATAWLIYLADRLADSFTIPVGAAMSARQRFAVTHRIGLIVAMICCALVLAVSAFSLERRTLAVGALLGVVAVIYLAINQFAARVWRVLPVKEIVIGCLFAAGTCAAVRNLDLIQAAAFAILCSLNCICIAVWERELDQQQRRDSIATTFPRFIRIPFYGCPALAVAAALLGAGRASMIYIAVSAALLALLNVKGERLSGDVRTALADIVLLSPLSALFVT